MTEHWEKEIYSRRYTDREKQIRAAAWKVLCAQFLQRYVRPNDVVVDLAANDGSFITNIEAGYKIGRQTLVCARNHGRLVLDE